MISFQDIFDIFSTLTAILVLSIIAIHILFRIFGKKEPLKLDKNSFVVITGACMGIGRQMAIEIATLYKCSILVVDIRKDLFDQITKQVTEAGGTCECKCTNLGHQQSVNELNNFLLARNQPINLFLYNAGIMIPRTTWQQTEEQHHLVMNVNYFTPTVMIKRLEPLLIGNHVSVIVSMLAIINGGILVSSYSASKHALYGYLCSLRQEYKKFGKNISLSIGCPYAINTTMFQGFRTKLDMIVRVLDQKYVAKRLVKQFVERKEECFMYIHQAYMFKLFSMLPNQVIDFLSVKLDVSRYAQQVKKTD